MEEVIAFGGIFRNRVRRCRWVGAENLLANSRKIKFDQICAYGPENGVSSFNILYLLFSNFAPRFLHTTIVLFSVRIVNFVHCFLQLSIVLFVAFLSHQKFRIMLPSN